MKILLSNDDGIESNGLKALANELSDKNEVLVVAPNGNRTACSHSLSIRKKLKLKQNFSLKNCLAYSLSGTPVDCVKFAKLHFKNFSPDVIVAGINKGHNLGSDILYSGTVAIALEASFFGNVSFAFSAFSLGDSNFEIYSKYARRIIEVLLPLSNSGDIWNVNFPDDIENAIKGIKVTSLGKQLYTDRYESIGNEEFMLVGELVDHEDNQTDCDIEWIKKGYITVTPINFDRTNVKKIIEIKKVCEKLL